MAAHHWLALLNYAHPLGVYSTFLVSSLLSHSKRHRISNANKGLPAVTWGLQLGLATTFLVSASLVISPFIDALSKNQSAVTEEAALFSYTAGFLFFAAGLLPDPHVKFSPSQGHLHSWLCGLLIETSLLFLDCSQIVEKGTPAQCTLRATRIMILAIMCAIVSYQMYSCNLQTRSNGRLKGLLQQENGNRRLYGATDGGRMHEASRPQEPEQNGGWVDYFIGFAVLFPYLWPKESRKHQLILVLSLIFMVNQRLVNILVPYQISMLVEAIGVGKIPYKEIGLYVLYRSLQGQQGILGATRAIFWIPARQSLFRRLTCAAFEHVLSLSREFHLDNRIGEVLSALSKGSAMNTFIDSFAFELCPMIFDLGVAAVYFSIRFDVFYSLILLLVMWSYIYVTIYMAQWRATVRRDMALKEREMDAARLDAMLSYDTVHYSGAVAMEAERFASHVSAFQHAERAVLLSLNVLNITQNLILSAGALLFVLLSSYLVSIDVHGVAVFVSILSYLTQLQAPLQFFGSFYNQVQNNLIDAERMLDLFKIKPTIVDSESAHDLGSCKGHIEFKNVAFEYGNGNRVLSGISFTVQPRTSTAIVGESGSGKSTCLKLLFRFHDPSSGSILIDGQNIRDLKLLSYRQHIGVVPQDATLFNASIMYNLQYGRAEASEEDIFEACRVASIHTNILGFPDGYDTKIGERGLRLSGGEKQRIAIAREIIQNPQIVLLDEATSSLDAHTEEHIQGALDRATTERTTITVAHRLCTITKCDQILVLHNGSIVEKGTHEELLTRNGRYSKMWKKQTTTANKT